MFKIKRLFWLIITRGIAYSLVIIVTIIGLIVLDMGVSQSWYHPLIYPYQFLSGISCFVSDCHQPGSSSIAEKGMVVTARSRASEVGQNILEQGGNAVDAAVAVGYALAVVHPCCGNLGGGGFMVIHLDGEDIFLNFREKAPQAAFPELYQQQGMSSRQGYSAVAIPGTVKGLNTALKRYGTMSREEVMQGAITLAREGFILSEEDIQRFERELSKWKEQPQIAEIFLKDGQFPYVAGERLVQKTLAQDLQLIAEKGDVAFYQGEIAEKLVAASEKNGGLITSDDLAGYTVTANSPVSCQYRGYEVRSAALPGGGVTLCELLNILEGYDLSEAEEVKRRHWMLSAMLYAFADRNSYLGDPAFVDPPVERLLSPDYATFLRAKIGERAIPPEPLFPNPANEGQHTTHYSVRDRAGNAVSVTYTINSFFGAGVMAEGTGFFLNNEMDDFATAPGKPNQFGLVQGKANQVEPGKRPLSSMSPTIVLKEGKPILITGSPGGPTIITTIMQVITNWIDRKMSLTEAVSEPRFHYQGLPNFVLTEPYALNPSVVEGLWRLGYRVFPLIDWGAAESILVEETQVQGVNDPRRRAGKASGY